MSDESRSATASGHPDEQSSPGLDETAVATQAEIRSRDHRELSGRVLRSGFLMGVRRIVTLVITGVSTVFITRALGAQSFGGYAAALSVAQLLCGLADFGFSLLLARDLAQDINSTGRLIRAALRAQTAWSLLLAVIMVAIALLTGLSTVRGQVLLALTPLVAFYGAGVLRQFFVVNFDVGFLARVDVASGLLAGVAMIVVAVTTRSPVGVAIAFCATSVLASFVVARAGFRRIDSARPTPREVLLLVRRVVPLGTMSVLSNFYFTIDLALLGWLVTGPQLGNYALAVKVLSMLVALPTLVMSTALPGLSGVADSRERLSRLVATLVQTMSATCLPFCIAAAVFAPTVVQIGGGSHYAGAVPLVRILAVSGAVSALANAVGTGGIAVRAVRMQVTANTVALVFNVVGNLLLAPRYGVTASAWLTLATEVLVGTWMLAALIPRIDLADALRLSTPAFVGTAALAAVGLLLGRWPGLAIAASAVIFVAVVSALRGWPDEFGLEAHMLKLWSGIRRA